MPLARSNTSRNRSRSPAPPTASQLTSTSPPQFQPPSFYAAAGGYTIPPANNRHTMGYDRSGVPTTMNEPENAFMPITYLAGDNSDSESSFEFKHVSETRPSLDRKPSKASIELAPRQRRLSQMANLPQVEAQLLPSLRDTITRMTRPPSHITPQSSPAHSFRFEASKSGRIERTFSPCPPPTEPNESRWKSPRIQTSRPSTPRTPSTAEQPPDEPLTPKAKQPPPKSALKSALRAPTPKLFSPKPDVAETSSSPHIGGSALRSVRSLLRRKSSASSASTLDSIPAPQILKNARSQDFQPPIQTRSRSRTDPGVVPSPKIPPRNAATPQPGPYTLSGQSSQSFPSNIPRPRGKSMTNSRTTTTDDSDLEYRYEVEGRDKRKLVVANAEVLASSSESENESLFEYNRYGEKRLKSGAKEMRQVEDLSNGYDPRRPIGLGLGFNQVGGRAETMLQDGLEDVVVYEGDRYERKPRLAPRPPPPPPDKSDRYRGLTNTPTCMDDLEESHSQRRAALMGLVQGLEQHFSESKGPGEGEDSEYCGEEGLAISCSGDVGGGGRVVEDSESEYEDDEEEGEVERQPMPTVLVSHHVDDDYYEPSNDGFSSSYPHRDGEGRQTPSTPSFSSNLSPRTSSSKLDRDSNGRSPSPSATTRSPHLLPQRPRDSYNYEAVKIAQHSRAAEARERQALGLPPSVSDEVYQGGGQRLSQADSVLSAIGSGTWQEDAEELSVGAEALFRKISSGGEYQNQGRRRSQIDPVHPGRDRPPPERRRQQQQQRATPISRPPSPPPKEYSIPESSAGNDCSSWRSSVGPAMYTTLTSQYGEVEMQRQEVIWELCETEATFVDRLYTIVRLFILPLRIQDSKTWIAGVPSEIAKLLDWLEDIVNLHSQISSALEGIQNEQNPVVERIAGPLRVFVPRLEVYQPYLVRFADVSGMIGELVRDEGSDLGEFVRIQENAEECDGWKLEELLVEPVQRLASFTSLFRRLLELTPKGHQDFFSTLSLLRSTDMVIKVLAEVKVREDEYDLIKRISERIVGPPRPLRLAKRDRRLLYQGALERVKITSQDENSLRPRLKTNIPIPRLHRIPYGGSQDSPTSSRTNHLVSAINEWDRRRGRSGSSASASSSGTNSSSRSYGSSSSGSTNPPATPTSPGFNSNFWDSVQDSRYAKPRLPYQTSSRFAGITPGGQSQTVQSTSVQVFVFTDLVILTTWISRKRQGSSAREQMALLDDIGMAKIIDVTELCEGDLKDSPLIVLDVLPLNLSDLDGNLIPDTVSLDVLYLTIPGQQGAQNKIMDDEARQAWLTAFRNSLRSTLRSSAIPSDARGYLISDFDLNLDEDMQDSMESLLSSGLPLPKSPSLQFNEDHASQDKTRREREERGWWSLRFQQVLREMQRQEVSFSADVSSSTAAQDLFQL